MEAYDADDMDPQVAYLKERLAGIERQLEIPRSRQTKGYRRWLHRKRSELRASLSSLASADTDAVVAEATEAMTIKPDAGVRRAHFGIHTLH